MYERETNRTHTIVIGGGQAGLTVGYYLKQRGIPFLILDAHQRVGDAWRNRWDSLRLFTPSRYSGLPGMPFPTRDGASPTKDEMADYLEAYAEAFDLPVLCGVQVDRLSKQGNTFLVYSGSRRWEAQNVVVAMTNYQVPSIPAFASDLEPSIHQLHSHNYRNPSQLKSGDVLVVGAGNSAADIAQEVSRSHRTWMSGKESGHIPWRVDTLAGRLIFSRIFRLVFHHVLTLDTPIGRKARPKMLHGAAPLVRVKPKDLIAAGVERVPRVAGVSAGKPLLDDGRTLAVKNVIWCTGYQPGFSWINIPIFDHHGLPNHERGVVPSVSGLYFVGLQFQYAMSSSTLLGVARDAEFIVNALVERAQTSRASGTEAELAIA